MLLEPAKKEQAMSMPLPAPGNAPGTANPRLHGSWLLHARMACAAGALLAVGPFMVSLLVRFAHLNRLSTFDVPDGRPQPPSSLPWLSLASRWMLGHGFKFIGADVFWLATQV